MRFLLGWQQVGIMLFALGVTTGLINYGYSILAVPIGHEFGASRTTMMLGITGMTLVSALAAPLFGAFMDRYSIRLAMTFGAFTLGIGLFALSFITAMWQVIAIYALLMAPAILAFGPMSTPALLTRWFIKRRGLALGIAATGYSIGGFILPPILTKLVALYQWREAVQIAGVFVILCLVPAVFLLVVNHPSDRHLNPDGEARAATVDDRPMVRHSAVNLALLGNPNFWFIALAVGIPLSGASALLSNIMPYAGDHGIAPSQAALILSTFAVCSLAGKLAFAALGDRVDLRILLAVSECVSLLAFLVFAFGGSVAVIFAASAFYSFGLAIAVPLWGALVARAFGAEGLGSVMGTMAVFVSLLGMITPALFGMIRDKTGTYMDAFLLFAALMALMLVLLSRVRYAPRETVAAPAVTQATA